MKTGWVFNMESILSCTWFGFQRCNLNVNSKLFWCWSMLQLELNDEWKLRAHWVYMYSLLSQSSPLWSIVILLYFVNQTLSIFVAVTWPFSLYFCFCSYSYEIMCFMYRALKIGMKDIHCINLSYSINAF